ncbi:MAG: hypothetical protein DMG13_17515 [Acidobacteria bacterium]|nr:MAG: hypothetical protein DMG13_17515 [Acidobacteriota bacterium]
MKLTIIIPTYDRHSGVVECALALEHNGAEIIIVDDGSEQPVALPSKAARLIRHERHRGRAAAINTGLKAASHDLVLITDDDICAAPDMVSQMVDAFRTYRNPKLALTGRVVWDPDIPLTLTMRWLEQVGKFPAPTLLWRPFIFQQGGYDENFTAGLEQVELQLRLKQHGLESRLVESALGFRIRNITIRDLVEREFMDGLSAVYLHSKFPHCMPDVDNMDSLLRNEKQTDTAEAAVLEIALMEQSDTETLSPTTSDLFEHICRHYFLHGIFEGLRDMGGIKQRRQSSGTVAISNEAFRLSSIGEFDEAKRLFRLVLHRPDEEYWDGAEYHLGCIESSLGNEPAAHSHFIECLRLNPSHNEARQALNKPSVYREMTPNTFERIEALSTTKVLFVLFGELADVIHAFPVVSALKKKFSSEVVWLTSSRYAALARASFADAIHEAKQPGIFPWDWIHSEGFTHVFYPECGANLKEWNESGLHPIEFMSAKCGVQLETHKTWLKSEPGAVFQAEGFLAEHGLKRGEFLTASHVGASSRHWPHTNLMKLAKEIGLPVIVFGEKTDPEIPGTFSCFGKPLQMIAALIGWSSFYIGPDSGISWIATTTSTPMAVFMDPLRQEHLKVGFRDALRGEKDDIEEWGIYTSADVVIGHIQKSISNCELRIANLGHLETQRSPKSAIRNSQFEIHS